MKPLTFEEERALLITAGAYPFDPLKEHDARCPSCGAERRNYSSSITAYQGPNHRKRVCQGSWWRSCDLPARHFHCKCATCGYRWIMAPANLQLNPPTNAPFVTFKRVK